MSSDLYDQLGIARDASPEQGMLFEFVGSLQR